MALIALPVLGTALLWLAICGGLVVAGLKRWRWGTPGGKRAVVAGAAGTVGLLVPAAAVGVAAGTEMASREFERLMPAVLMAAGLLWVLSTAALASAARAAVRAAHAARAGA